MSTTCLVESMEARTDDQEAIALAKRIIEDGSKVFSDDETTAFRTRFLPDIAFVIEDGNSTELLAPTDGQIPYSVFNLASRYPRRSHASFRTIQSLSEDEDQKRAQRIAVRSSIYSVMAGEDPFLGSDKEPTQERYEQGGCPAKVVQYPLKTVVPMLSSWNREFVEKCRKLNRFLLSVFIVAKAVGLVLMDEM